MNIIELIELIERKNHYKVYINPHNCNIEMWSFKGIRVHEFKNEDEQIAFLKGVYYTQIDMQYDTSNH